MLCCCSTIHFTAACSSGGSLERNASTVSISLVMGFFGGLFRSLDSHASPLDFAHLLSAMRMRPIFSGVRLWLYVSIALSTALISELRGVRSSVSVFHC